MALGASVAMGYLNKVRVFLCFSDNYYFKHMDGSAVKRLVVQSSNSAGVCCWNDVSLQRIWLARCGLRCSSHSANVLVSSEHQCQTTTRSWAFRSGAVHQMGSFRDTDRRLGVWVGCLWVSERTGRCESTRRCAIVFFFTGLDQLISIIGIPCLIILGTVSLRDACRRFKRG